MAELHTLEGSSAPTGAPPMFDAITDTEGSDAALIRLGCRLEASFSREKELCKIVYKDEDADDVDIEAQIRVTSETVDSILPIRATTAAGLAVKLRAWMWAMNDFTPAEVEAESDVTSNKIMASVCADAMALQSGTAFVPPSTFDQPLIEAWAEHQRICVDLIALREKAEALEEVTRPLLPGPAEALFIREDDFPGTSIIYAGARLQLDGRQYYPLNTIEWLRKAPTITAPFAERAAEIVKAHDDTIAAAEEIRKQTGLATALAAVEEAEGRLNAIADKMLDIPALSLRGIGLKASWALTHTAKGEGDISGVLQQVEAFARRHAYGDMPNVPRIERTVMGGMPAADWHLYRLFGQWFRSATEMRSLEAEHEAAVSAHGIESDKAEAAWTAFEQEATREWAFRKAVRETRAASIQGVQLKAIVYAWLCRDDESMRDNESDHGGGMGSVSDTSFAFNIAREMAMIGAPGVLDTGAKPEAKPDRRAMESYRTWLQNEFTSLTHEMYPGMPQMLGAISVNNAGDRFHFRGEPPASSRAEMMLDMFALDWRADDSLFADRLGEKAA